MAEIMQIVRFNMATKSTMKYKGESKNIKFSPTFCKYFTVSGNIFTQTLVVSFTFRWFSIEMDA